MVSVNMREMLEAGVHFGHQVRRWNPKMKPYIYGKKNGIYIINLQTAIELFKSGLNFITDVVASGRDALIVGTKKQAQAIIEDISEETGMHYVHKRWLGGLLTNFSMIRKSIEKLIDLEEMKKDGRWEVKSKKEQSKLEKIYKKLYKNLWGIRNIKELPGVVIVIDSTFESIAVYEAKKLNIPLVAVVDTNADPEEIDYPIPGNDDAIRSIRLFVTKFGEAVKSGMEKRISDTIVQTETEEKAEPESIETAEVESTEEPEAKKPEEKTEKKEEKIEVKEVKAEAKKEEKKVKEPKTAAKIEKKEPEAKKPTVKKAEKKETKTKEVKEKKAEKPAETKSKKEKTETEPKAKTEKKTKEKEDKENKDDS